MKELINKFWPLLAVAVAVLIFFYPVWLKGLVPLPADFIVGTYYPWLDYKWPGFATGVPVKNPITTDVVSFIFPMQMFAIEQIKVGIVPLWNNLILAGTPLMANFQSAPFSPTNIIYFILPTLTSWTIQIILQSILAAIFMYMLLRYFKLSSISSLAGGIFYAFAGFLLIWLQWNGHTLTAAFFPLILLLTIKWVKNPSIVLGIGISVIQALQIFSGYPQIILYQFLALIVCVLINEKSILKQPKKFIPLSLYFILGIGLAGIQLLPAIELLSNSQRKIEDVINVSAFLPWQYLITFIAPDFFGNHATGNFWGEGDYTLVTGYSGIIVVLLATTGLQVFTKSKGVLIALGLIILSLVIALPNPISLLLKQSGFLALQAASAHRILFLSNAGFAMLAAFGIEGLWLSKAKVIQLIRALYLPFSLWLIFFILTVYIIKLVPDKSLVAGYQIGFRNLQLPILLLSFAGFLILCSLFLKKWHKIFILLLVTSAIFELFRFGWKFTPFSPQQFTYPKTPVLDFLQRQPGNFRVSAEDVIPINFMMSYSIQMLEGYDAVYPIRIARYLASLNSSKSDNTPMGRYGSVTNYNSNLLDIANVKYVLALKKNKQGSPDKNGQIPEKFNKQKYRPVFEDGSVAVLENTTVWPRAFIAYDWQIKNNDNEVLSDLINSTSANGKIILDQDPKIIKNVRASQTADYQQKYNQKIITVNSDQNGVLFVGDTYFPGWKAYMDGTVTNLLRADYNFMAVPVPAGKHQIKIIYQPESFKYGLIISFSSLSCLLIMLTWYYIRKYGKS